MGKLPPVNSRRFSEVPRCLLRLSASGLVGTSRPGWPDYECVNTPSIQHIRSLRNQCILLWANAEPAAKYIASNTNVNSTTCSCLFVSRLTEAQSKMHWLRNWCVLPLLSIPMKGKGLVTYETLREECI
jgi:hypothetical protein